MRLNVDPLAVLPDSFLRRPRMPCLRIFSIRAVGLMRKISAASFCLLWVRRRQANSILFSKQSMKSFKGILLDFRLAAR